jgi:DNA-binding transcriptional LysR family regulator
MQRYDDLLIFVRVVERGSFVGAARQLGLPPTTVSRKVQELEARLGSQLLRRTTRRVAVTETGQAVYETAARGFAAIEEAERLRPQAPRRALGRAQAHHAARLLAPAIRAVAAGIHGALSENPRRAAVDQRALNLVEYGVDVAIRAGPQHDSSYIKRALFRGGFAVVASPEYLARVERPRSPRDLADHPIAIVANMLDRSYGPHAVPSTYSFEKDGKYEEIIFAPVLSVNDPDPLVAFALEGAGIAVVFEAMSRDYIAQWRARECLRGLAHQRRNRIVDPLYAARDDGIEGARLRRVHAGEGEEHAMSPGRVYSAETNARERRALSSACRSRTAARGR